MRLGLVSDIHGNLPALEAVLAQLDGERLDHLVCLGDVAVGPQPHECLERVRALACPVIMGNWDAWFLDGMPDWGHDPIGCRLVEVGAFWAEQLSEDDRAFMRTFEPTRTIADDGTPQVLLFHGSPRSYTDWIVASTVDDELEEMFDGQAAPILIGGHTHLQMLRRFRRATIVNPGSVGLPFQEWPANPIRVWRWGEYAVLELDEDGRVDLQLRQASYDVDSFVARGLASGMPHADWWAEAFLPPPPGVLPTQRRRSVTIESLTAAPSLLRDGAAG